MEYKLFCEIMSRGAVHDMPGYAQALEALYDAVNSPTLTERDVLKYRIVFGSGIALGANAEMDTISALLEDLSSV